MAGLPRKTVVTSDEIREALTEPVNQIVEAVIGTLEHAEPELSADLVDNGMLAGGGALLRGMDVVISNATGLDARIAEDPLTCVAAGPTSISRTSSWKATYESDPDEALIAETTESRHGTPRIAETETLLLLIVVLRASRCSPPAGSCRGAGGWPSSRGSRSCPSVTGSPRSASGSSRRPRGHPDGECSRRGSRSSDGN